MRRAEPHVNFLVVFVARHPVQFQAVQVTQKRGDFFVAQHRKCPDLGLLGRHHLKTQLLPSVAQIGCTRHGTSQLHKQADAVLCAFFYGLAGRVGAVNQQALGTVKVCRLFLAKLVAKPYGQQASDTHLSCAGLAALAKHTQVIVVTHLPQVAARAAQHMVVAKELRNERMQTSVRVLNQGERPQEIARLMSGEVITEAALQNAENLLNEK